VQSLRWRLPWLVCCAALLCAAAFADARAQDQRRFEVRNAFVELIDDAWLLDARFDLALGKSAQQALDEGVPLVFVLEAEASLERRFIPDETIVSLTLRWQLAYDAISEHYVLTDLSNDEQVSHASQAEALEALSRISGIEVADTTKLPPDGRFDMRVRATVDIGELPAAIKMLVFWKSWSRSTDWYAWSVRP
jgi:Domain of unknown function (DUF4390)